MCISFMVLVVKYMHFLLISPKFTNFIPINRTPVEVFYKLSMLGIFMFINVYGFVFRFCSGVVGELFLAAFHVRVFYQA